MLKWFQKNTSTALQIILLVLGFAGGIYVSVAPANSLMRWYNIDDAFYYYKVAQNVLTGHGFTFDQINLTNGFHPMWMVVCLGVFWLSRFNLLLPLRVLVLVSALFNAFTGVFLFRLIKKALRTWPAFIGALTWILLPSIYSTTIVHGMEAAISAFFMVLFLLQASRILLAQVAIKLRWQQFLMLGLLGGLTILSRLDNVFVVAVVGFFVLLRVRQIRLVVFLDLVIIALTGFVSWLVRLGLPAFELDSKSIYPMVAAGLLIKPVAFYFAGIYQRNAKKNLIRLFLRLVVALVISLIVEFGILTLLNRAGILPTVSKSIMLIESGVCLGLVFVHHWLAPAKTEDSNKSPFNIFSTWFKLNWRRILVEGGSFALPIGILLGAYVTLNKIFFGTFTPVSGQIKTWWSTLPNTIYGQKISLLTVLGLSPDGNNGSWSLVTSQLFGFAETLNRWFGFTSPRSTAFIFAIAFTLSCILVLMVLNYKHGILAKKLFSLFIPALMLGATIQIMYYTTVGYQHTRSWYWTAQMLSMVLLGSVLLEGFILWLNKTRVKKTIAQVFLVVLTTYIITLHLLYVISLAPQKVSFDDQDEYLTEIIQLESLTREGSLIGMTGGGNVAYFIHDRTIINLDGLINSAAYFNAIKSGTAQKWLDDLHLEYAFGKEYTLELSDPYAIVFSNRLEEIGKIRGPEQFTLFKYVIKD
jgi:hypothetical protein